MRSSSGNECANSFFPSPSHLFFLAVLPSSPPVHFLLFVKRRLARAHTVKIIYRNKSTGCVRVPLPLALLLRHLLSSRAFAYLCLATFSATQLLVSIEESSPRCRVPRDHLANNGNWNLSRTTKRFRKEVRDAFSSCFRGKYKAVPFPKGTSIYRNRG